MRSRTLAVAAGTGAMILTSSASAGFVGITVVQKTAAQDTFGLFVCNVYAVFDNSAGDELIAVSGTPDNPLNIFVKNGNFFQHARGSVLTAPFLQFIPPPPNNHLAYDTFVTIGTKTDDLFTTLDNVSTTPGFGFAVGNNQTGQPNLNNGPLQTISGSWFILPSGPGNGGPGAPNANGQVLIFQGSFNMASGAGIAGTMVVEYTADGVTGQQSVVSFDHQICPWDCDGLDDGIVGVTDLLVLLAQYDPMAPDKCIGQTFCDYDGNGCVDVGDLLKLLAHYDPAGVGCPQ